MTTTIKVKAHELLPGDRILGTQLIIASVAEYSEYHMGSNVERQRYTYKLTNGRTITYFGASPGVSVLRAEGETF